MARKPNRPTGPRLRWKRFALGLAVLTTGAASYARAVGAPAPHAPAVALVTATTTPTPRATAHAPVLPLPRLTEPTNVLFMACDNTDEYEQHGRVVVGMRGNTDTMIVARLDPGRHQVRLLSIPRDTRVPIPGHGTFKINAANPYGGPALAMRVVSSFLGVPVNKYLLINTRAVVQLVDAVGGVKVFVPKNLNYDDDTGHLHIHLTKGWHHLDGQHAHDYLRFRHDDLGDIGRVQRQQWFLDAFFRQFLRPSTVLAAPRLLALAHRDVSTNLSPLELLRMVDWGKDLTAHDVQLSMVPGTDAMIAGGWYWIADPASTRSLVHGFLYHDAPLVAHSPAGVRVAVMDGVGDTRALAALRRALRRSGYVHLEDDGPAAEPGELHTRIIAQRADVSGARALARTLGVGRVEVDATGVLSSDFTVVMGKDWIRALPKQRSTS